MIYLLNESKTPWELKEQKGRVVAIERKLVEEQDANTFTVKHVSLLVNRNVKMKAKHDSMKSYVKMFGKLQPLSNPGSTFVTYDGPTFKPVAIPSSRADQPFLLLTLPKLNTKKARVKFEGAEMLDFVDIGDEFSAIVRFKEGDTFKIAIRRSAFTIVYTFTYNKENGLTHTSEKVDVKEVKNFSKRLSKYRMYMPTELVLVQEDDLKKVETLIKKRYANKTINIKTYNNKYDLEKGLKDLFTKYKAVTLYCDTTFKKETAADKAKYAIVGNLLETCFTVQKMHVDGSISRVRIN